LSLLAVNVTFNGAFTSRLADQHEREMNAETHEVNGFEIKYKQFFK